MSQYYYLVASLPYLSYGDEPSMSGEEFLSLCREQMGDGDFAHIRETRLFPSAPTAGQPPLLRTWNEWETSLRNALVDLRAGGLGKESEAWIRPSDAVPETSHVAREAFGQSSPLAAEEVLDRARWKFLDYGEVGHYFDLERLIAYFLKLQILLRKSRMTAEQGSRSYEAIYKAITENLNGGNPSGRIQVTGADT